jgi:hypothetical protein
MFTCIGGLCLEKPVRPTLCNQYHETYHTLDLKLENSNKCADGKVDTDITVRKTGSIKAASSSQWPARNSSTDICTSAITMPSRLLLFEDKPLVLNLVHLFDNEMQLRERNVASHGCLLGNAAIRIGLTTTVDCKVVCNYDFV